MAVNVISSSIFSNFNICLFYYFPCTYFLIHTTQVSIWHWNLWKNHTLLSKTSKYTFLDSCNCGKANDNPTKSVSGDYIDGGLETSKNKYPWVVSFRRVSKHEIKHDEKGFMFNRNLGCTGALLDTKHVLIAAHCIFKEEFYKWNIHGILILCIMKDSLDINTM